MSSIDNISNGVSDQAENVIEKTDGEKAVLDAQVAVANEKQGYFVLYRYADWRDILLMLICSICAIAAGIAAPLMTVGILRT